MTNASFESGASGPAPWQVSGPGAWENFGRTGDRCVSVAGSNYATRSWFAPLDAETGKPYWVRFWVSATNSVRGYVFGGISTAVRDFYRPSERWTDPAYAAWVPAAGAPLFRLNSWDGSGPVYFDDVEVLPLNQVHKRAGDYELGAGETLKDGRYTFQAQFNSFGGNCSRAIHQANTTYNTYRWYFNAGSEVVYRHELAGEAFTNASVSCLIQNPNNLTAPTLIVEAGTDGLNWLPAGAMQFVTSASFPLPAELQPSPVLFVRMRSTNAGLFMLNGYTFAADVPDTTTDVTGHTHHLGKLHPGESVQVLDIQNTSTGRVATLAVPNAGVAVKWFECSAATTSGSVVRERVVATAIAPGGTNIVALLVPTSGAGENTAVITVRDVAGDTVVFQQIHRFTVSMLADDSYGELLPSPPECAAWTCTGAYKVGRTRGVPLVTNDAVEVTAARNEYEPFQLVLRPAATLSNVMVTIGNFISATNPAFVINATNVTVDRVEYVAITQPDPANFASVLGDHPDPLPPLTAPFTAPGGTNSPLWFTVYVPKDSPAGEYTASITVQYDGGGFTMPVRLRVFDFALTDVTHSRTAYGLVPQENWHGLNWATPQQKGEIWELYLRSMARHRVSPFHPQLHAPIDFSYNPATDTFTYFFDSFDAAMDRYLEEYHFNSFRDVTFYAALPYIPGVPTFAADGSITPEYRRAYVKFMQPILQHFRERGWLELAYAHWIDEPPASKLPVVRQGMEMIQEAGPDHGRMMSTFFGPMAELFDLVNLWVPHWDLDMNFQYVEPRRTAGDQVWYYVCTIPKDPWPNNFIDQPGVSPRIRQWYAEMQQLDGEAYYGINQYLGTTNPWVQTMSFYGDTNIGFHNLGHGDGNLVYPPVRERPVAPDVVMAGPINSIRYENTREGFEDREYFWLLQRALAVMEPLLGTNHPAVIEGHAAYAHALGLLSWPPIYPYEAHVLEAARLRVAEAIEALDDGAPFIAKDPLSKVCRVGANQTLRVEASGWPVPAIQWQRDGTNLPGANSWRLVLTNLTTDLAGEYRVIASNALGSITSAVGRLTVLVTNQPPLILAQPVSLTRGYGTRAVFGAGISSLTPLRYQWLHNGAPLAGATNTTLALTNLNDLHAGTYTLIASNSFGSVTSSPALLSIQAPAGSAPPVITSPLSNQVVSAGQTVQLSVTATGTSPLNYQWFFHGTNLPTVTNTSVLNFTNVQPAHAGPYQVVIGNVAGWATGEIATLTVQTFAPFIVSGPTNLLAAEGQHVQYSVVAGGTAPLAYQWFFNETNLLAGAINSVLPLTNLQPAQFGSYRVRVTNAVGAVTSAPAALTLAGMPAYTTEPPGLAAEREGGTFLLTLAPDNRSRAILVSSNLFDWTAFSNASPSAAFVRVPVTTTNPPKRFFRLSVEPEL